MKVVVTIVIPTFNSEKTIAAALDSIGEQTFAAYEVLCIDGQSSDGTVALLKAYAQKNARVKWLSEPDSGIYDAMNKGIAQSEGDWLLFLGGDDCLHDREVLRDVAQVLAHTTARVVYGDAILLSDQQRYGGAFDVMRLHTAGNLCHQTVFYHRKVFDSVGPYNLKYHVLSDWELNIRCFRHPQIETKYLMRDIVLFNNVSGISSQPYDDPLLQELPLRYMQELQDLKSSRLLNSPVYKAAKNVYQKVRSIF